ncbi:hypothetical protein ACIQ6Y_22955 [Streptomyces sp. NPDC096205]|uniref:hypothetical protein n=1 Tax=Streptomyces sp. NPDC096205 TaxID=3366081 RepID=UPI0037F61AB3
MSVTSASKTTAVAGAVLALMAGGVATAGPAHAAPAPGAAAADIALGQYQSTNAEVRKRIYEGDAKDGDTEKNNCNFYTGFWTAKANYR